MTFTLVFATSAIVTLVGGAVVRRVAIRYGAVVPTRPDRWHRHPTPTFGGAAILVGLLAGVLFQIGALLDAAPVLVACIALFAIGWYDDVRPMSALAKMVSSLAVAAFFVFSLVPFETPALAALSLVAIVWFGGTAKAGNLLANIDGT